MTPHRLTVVIAAPTPLPSPEHVNERIAGLFCEDLRRYRRVIDVDARAER